MSKFDHITIEPSEYSDFAVYGHGTYERSSVLAGQPKRSYLESFDTVVDAQKEYPNAEVLEHSTKIDGMAMMPVCAPDWFDPMDAGECWHEDDY